MNGILLSDDAYKTLRQYYNGKTPDPPFEILSVLVEYGFVANEVIDYDISGDFVDEIHSAYHITEYGKGYYEAYERRESEVRAFRELADASRQSAEESKRFADNAERIADAAEKAADAASKKAAKADIKSIISLVFAGTALVFEFAINHESIIGFFMSLLTSR